MKSPLLTVILYNLLHTYRIALSLIGYDCSFRWTFPWLIFPRDPWRSPKLSCNHCTWKTCLVHFLQTSEKTKSFNVQGFLINIEQICWIFHLTLISRHKSFTQTIALFTKRLRKFILGLVIKGLRHNVTCLLLYQSHTISYKLYLSRSLYFSCFFHSSFKASIF